MLSNSEQSRYDPEMEQSACDFIIKQMAEYKNIDRAELPYLYDYINPDVLNNIFVDPEKTHPGLEDGYLRFRWADVLITVYADGRIQMVDDGNAELADGP